MKNPRGKGQRGSGERAQTTLAAVLTLIDAAADEKEVNRIIGGLSRGTQAILYSALLYTQPASEADEQLRNRSYALHILREFLL